MTKTIEQLKADQFEIQKAIKYLIDHILDQDGQQLPLNTDKPLLIHSLKVAMTLYEYGYRKEVVIAAILHDLNEDAELSIAEIKKSFGVHISELVDAMTYDRTIADEKVRAQDAMDKKVKIGRDAIVIAVADRWANLPYINYLDHQQRLVMLDKHHHFINTLGKQVSNEPIFQDYSKALKKYN